MLAGLQVALVSCKSTPAPEQEQPPEETLLFSAPQEDLSSIKYEPSFEPDYNRLTPQPWVEPVTQAQQDAADVYPDRIEFPATLTEVLGWEAGRVVVGAPSQGAGKNALGFARRVVSVTSTPPKIVVTTKTVPIEELLQGELQLQLTPENSRPMDLSKADLDWVVKNLYANDPSADDLPGQPLVDDSPSGAMSLGFWSKITKPITTAAKAVASGAKDVYLAVTPATVSGSIPLSKELKVGSKNDLFNMSFSKSFNTPKGLPVEFTLKGKGGYDAGLSFNPGVQIGAKIALPGHNANSEFWLNVDSMLKARLGMEMSLDAALTSVNGESGATLQDWLKDGSKFLGDSLGAYRDQVLGSPDTKPSGGWKKTLYVSQPAVSTFAAGPVPVVVTSTFQVDLVCGFEAKAGLKATVLLEQNATFKFKVTYNKGTGKTTVDGPTFNSARIFDAQVTGAGEVSLTCGLIPRANVFLYDSVGLFAGVRAAAVATAKYASKCPEDPTQWQPTATVNLNLDAEVGVQAGARVQLPGSSLAGSAGTVVGYDIGVLSQFTKTFNLLKKEWKFAKGLGYCQVHCLNLAKDGDETDADCGGSCSRCSIGKSCKQNTDCERSVCNAGVCSANQCGDNVSDGQETDIDCGGAVAQCATRCAAGKTCLVGADCVSGYCGAKGTAGANTCMQAHCQDGVLDSDEGGIDCGGAECSKCANGVQVTAASHCASGLWNGAACVGAICDDAIKSGDETGPDCGGPTCARRCGFTQGCAASADCGASAPICNSARKVCLRGGGMACTAAADCDSGACTGGKCENPVSYYVGVWGTSNNSVWAVGDAGTLRKWNGTSWTPQSSGVTVPLNAVWGTGNNDVWAVGNSGTIL